MAANTPVAEPSLPKRDDLSAADRAGWPTEPLAESLGPLETRNHAFPDQVALELREHGEHPEHGPARGRGRVDRLIEYDEVDAERLELPAEGDQMRERTSEAIELGADDDVDLTPARDMHERVEAGTAFLCTAYAMVHVLVELPPSGPAVRPELFHLRRRILIGGGDARVDPGGHGLRVEPATLGREDRRTRDWTRPMRVSTLSEPFRVHDSAACTRLRAEARELRFTGRPHVRERC